MRGVVALSGLEESLPDEEERIRAVTLIEDQVLGEHPPEVLGIHFRELCKRLLDQPFIDLENPPVIEPLVR